METIGDVASELAAPTVLAPRPPRHYPAYNPAGTYAANAYSRFLSSIPPFQAPISSSYNVPLHQRYPRQHQSTTSFQANPELQGYGNTGDLSAPVARYFSSPFADQPVFARQVFLPSRPQMHPAMMQYYHHQPAGVAMERSQPYLESYDPVHAVPVAAVPVHCAAVPDAPPLELAKIARRDRASPRESAAAATSITATSYLAIPDALPKEPTKTARRGRGRGRARGASASRQTAPRAQPAPPSHHELPPQQHDDHMQEDSGSKNLKEEAAAGGGGAGAAELQVFPYADTSAIGVRFRPTDEELIAFIRLKHQYGQFADEIFKEFDVSKANPYTLQDDFGKSIDGSWYFFSPRYRRYDGGSRPARGIAGTEGYWKSTAKEKDIVDGGGKVIGKMNTLSFCRGKQPKGVPTPWRMKEYRIPWLQLKPSGPSPDGSYTLLDAWALYILYLRDGHTKADARNAGNTQADARNAENTQADASNAGNTQADTSNAGNTHEDASNANGDGENMDLSVDDYTIWDMDLAPAYKDILSSEQGHEQNFW